MRTVLYGGVALAALLAPVHAMAQETTATIRGSVTQGGAPVAGAELTITHVPSGTRSTAISGADGGFVASGLRVGGPFTVEVSSPVGNTTVTDVFTVLGQDFSLPIEISADSTAGDIVVTASAISGAGVTSDGPQTVLRADDISKVASVNRDIRDLARRDPFAALDLSNTRAISFAGTNPRFNRVTINGVQVSDNFGLNVDGNVTGRGPIPFDAIAQFSVSIAPYDIRQGNFAGGAINTVMKSGTNSFEGTGFYSLSTSDLQGKRIGSNTFSPPDYRSETYGATIAGPIIRDTLFFMVSAERNTDPRPLAISALTQIPGYSAAALTQITSIAAARFAGVPFGDFVTINDQKDEKIVGKIDWNVMDGQRLSLSYINAYEQNTVANGTSTSPTTPVIALGSNYYQRSNLLRAGIVQLNSDWTDKLSTEARALYRHTRVGQDSLLGTAGPQVRVCADATSVGSTTACTNGVPQIAFGPDNSRQVNQLFYDTWGGSLLARYRAGRHEFRMLAEYNENRTYNLFLQNANGAYYFDSIADFQAGTASGYNLQVPVNGDLASVGADFKFGQYTFGFEDDWKVTDRLSVTLGVRYDLFGMRTQVPLNTAYLGRYGFTNTKTYKGLDNFQPRASFNWDFTDTIRFRGGIGIFGGGSPDIYLSNSFSNTGVVSNALSSSTTGYGIIRSAPGSATCTGVFTGANAPLCTAALNNVSGSAIPASVVTYLQTNTAAQAQAPTSSLAQDLHLPSLMKATLSTDVRLFGFELGADVYHSNTLHAPAFTDLRARAAGTAPDGRPRYVPVTVVGDANSDYLFYDETRGRSWIGVVRFSKEFDWGLSFGGSYTWQDVKDVSPATSSTAGSLYGNQVANDPNFATYGIASDEIKWAFKYNLGFDKAFFGDYRTRIQLFGETRAGRHYSFTMIDNNSGRLPVYGVVGNNDRFLLYVPTSATDPLVTYADTTSGTLITAAQTRDSLEALINSTELKNYRGGIAPKNIARNRAFTRIDLHVEQEIPTFIGKSRISVWADIENLPNLINKDWGGLRQLGFPYSASVVQVACLSAAGVPLTGAVGSATNPAAGCARYQYSSYRAPAETSVRTADSLYLIRVGARFTF